MVLAFGDWFSTYTTEPLGLDVLASQGCRVARAVSTHSSKELTSPHHQPRVLSGTHLVSKLSVRQKITAEWPKHVSTIFVQSPPTAKFEPWVQIKCCVGFKPLDLPS